MKEKINKITNSKLLPYILLFIIILSINLFKNTQYRDDEWFSQITTGKIVPEITSIAKYVPWRYTTWSSRIPIEVLLIGLTMAPGIIWKILDSFVFVLFAIALNKVFCREDTPYMRWLCLFFAIFIPQILLESAGWIASSLNYTWVITFGIICLLPIRKSIEGKDFKWYEYILYVLCMIYACNSEQMCLVLFVVYTIFLLYLFKQKKLKLIHVILYLISIASLIFILLCPGNKARTLKEIEVYFPNFTDLNILQKIKISITSTMQYYFYEFNVIYVFFTAVIAIKVFIKFPKNILYKIIAIIPFLSGISFNIGLSVMRSLFPNLFTKMNSFLGAYVSGVDLNSILNSYIPLIIGFITLGCIVITVILSFDGNEMKILGMLCICAGICTRMMMGFLPSVFVSGNRTQFIFLTTMIATTLMLLSRMDEAKIRKYINVLIPFFVYSILNNLSVIL